MEYGLAGDPAVVEDDAEIIELVVGCYLPDDRLQMAQQRPILLGGIRELGDVLLRDDQDMGRSHGIEILEGHRKVVLVHHFGGDLPPGYFAEDAVAAHGYCRKKIL